MLLEQARKDIVAYGIRLLEEKLVSVTAGNLSVYDPETSLMAISPSGIPYPETKEEDVVVMTLEGEIVEGARKPSSEYGLHAAVYRVRPQAGAVVHTHSEFATTFSILGQPVQAVHFVLANVTGEREVPVAAYHTYGTRKLADAVQRIMKEHPACLLENHGMVAAGRNLQEACLIAQVVEEVARLSWRAQCLGTPRVLTEAQVKESFERYRTSYGQKQPARPAD